MVPGPISWETAPAFSLSPRARTRAGLREARTRGRVLGRKPKITAEQKKEIVEVLASGRKTAAEIARLFKIHPATVSRVLAQGQARIVV
jgi:DNA invertase Pin-like site-specific DNA recombinase